MKKDLFTAIITAIIGGIVGFVICSLFFGEIKAETIDTIDSSVNINLESPDPETFNADAINPTVEVYIGDSGDDIIVEGDE